MKRWFSWLRWVNPIYYSMESLISNEMDGLNFQCVSPALAPHGPSYLGGPQGCAVPGSTPGSTIVEGKHYMGTALWFHKKVRGAAEKRLGSVCLMPEPRIHGVTWQLLRRFGRVQQFWLCLLSHTFPPPVRPRASFCSRAVAADSTSSRSPKTATTLAMSRTVPRHNRRLMFLAAKGCGVGERHIPRLATENGRRADSASLRTMAALPTGSASAPEATAGRGRGAQWLRRFGTQAHCWKPSVTATRGTVPGRLRWVTNGEATTYCLRPVTSPLNQAMSARTRSETVATAPRTRSPIARREQARTPTWTRAERPASPGPELPRSNGQVPPLAAATRAQSLSTEREPWNWVRPG